ncbi:MAG: hypothetical protein IKI67_04685 [Bacteroidales bacterium]|nr:hypothetical protein [Bacteroidales bacterium]
MAESGASTLPEFKFKIMEDKNLMKGFSTVTEGELLVRGGINADLWRKVIKIVSIVSDFLSSYSEDFNRGYKKGLDGKPLWGRP